MNLKRFSLIALAAVALAISLCGCDNATPAQMAPFVGNWQTSDRGMTIKSDATGKITLAHVPVFNSADISFTAAGEKLDGYVEEDSDLMLSPDLSGGQHLYVTKLSAGQLRVQFVTITRLFCNDQATDAESQQCKASE